MTAGAVLLDIDGTLVDSNYLHIAAWSRGFRAVGEDVASSAVHQAIGMGTPQLLATLLGEAKAAAARQVPRWANGSGAAVTRASTSSLVNAVGAPAAVSATSSHDTGAETVGWSRARSE